MRHLPPPVFRTSAGGASAAAIRQVAAAHGQPDPAVPVRVDYALTPLGDSLMPAVNAVKSWAEGHIDEIKASRAEYDGRTAAGPNP
jgi:HxlR-like helix-turn-helix